MTYKSSVYVPLGLRDRIRTIAAVIEQMVDLYESPTLLVRTGLCPSCRQDARMQFLGVQDGFDGSAPLTLWECAICHTTVCGAWFLSPEDEAGLIRRYAGQSLAEPA